MKAAWKNMSAPRIAQLLRDRGLAAWCLPYAIERVLGKWCAKIMVHNGTYVRVARKAYYDAAIACAHRAQPSHMQYVEEDAVAAATRMFAEASHTERLALASEHQLSGRVEDRKTRSWNFDGESAAPVSAGARRILTAQNVPVPFSSASNNQPNQKKTNP